MKARKWDFWAVTAFLAGFLAFAIVSSRVEAALVIVAQPVNQAAAVAR
jgi:hypothetical protein